jgi:hypothetical protein
MMKEEAARYLEEHIQVLVDYDLIDSGVAETLTEYIWKAIGEIDPVVDVDSLNQIWKKFGEEEEGRDHGSV